MDKSQTSATNVTLLPLMQALLWIILKRTVEKSRQNAANVIVHPHGQAI